MTFCLKYKNCRLTLVCWFMTLSMLFASFVSYIVPIHVFNQKAYADGLTQENLPPASVGNRKASLFVKVNPPILTSDNRQDAYMQFRLFDANNNKTIQHVTYQITVTSGVTGTATSKPLLRDFFHAHNGLLTLKVQP